MKITSKIMSTQINIRILSNLVNQVKDFIVYSDYNVISSWALSLASACKIHYKHVPSIKHYKIKSCHSEQARLKNYEMDFHMIFTPTGSIRKVYFSIQFLTVFVNCMKYDDAC